MSVRAFNSVRVITPSGKERRITIKQARKLAVQRLGMSAAQANAADLFSLLKRLHDREVFTLHALRGAQFTKAGQALTPNPRRRRP